MTETHSMLVTMGTAIAAGIAIVTLSRRLNLSGVVLLLVGGLALGPTGLGIVQPRELGGGLPVIVSLAIALILFEGGLTLDMREYRSVSAAIQRLLTVGVLTTWLVTATAIKLIFSMPWTICLLAGSLVVVTGPTVIGPLLKRVKVNSRMHGILHWEGVMVDLLGVFLAILCFEWLDAQHGEVVLARFVFRLVAGVGLGIAGGLLINRLIRSRLVPADMMNVFSLASAVFVFVVAESLLAESGLLAVTIAGLVLGMKRPGELREIRQFKAEITDLMIGTLFVLLAARFDPGQFVVFGGRGILLVAVVMLVARPLAVLLSTLGLEMAWREKLFLSWVAPRGIVAASMASLFALNLQERGLEQAAFLETFTYSVIVATVWIQSFTAAPLAGLLGVRRPPPDGWLVVGAHPLARTFADFIRKTTQRDVTLIDTNSSSVQAALREGLAARVGDARDPELAEALEVEGVGNMLALTDNENLNMLLCERWELLRCTPSDVAGCRQAVIACDGSVGRSVPSAPYVWNIGMG